MYLADPETGEKGAREVTDLVRGTGTKHMVVLGFSDGTKTDATTNHLVHNTNRGFCEDDLVGDELVYAAYRNDDPTDAIEYVGITNDFNRRSAEHKRATDDRRKIRRLRGLDGLSHDAARGVEQTLIEREGIGNLENIRNSIAHNNPKKPRWVSMAEEVLKKAGM